MSKHTPGPWAVHPASAQVDAFATGEPVPVCQLLWPTDQRTETETEANAHLIAAAPEMLEALKSNVLAFEAFGITVPPEVTALIERVES